MQNIGMPQDTLRPPLVLAAFVAALAMAPVAPGAANILFLAIGAVGFLMLRASDVKVVRRPAVWMTLRGLILLALAYCGSSGAAGIVGLMFGVPLLTVSPLVAAALRTDLPPRLIA